MSNEKPGEGDAPITFKEVKDSVTDSVKAAVHMAVDDPRKGKEPSHKTTRFLIKASVLTSLGVILKGFLGRQSVIDTAEAFDHLELKDGVTNIQALFNIFMLINEDPKRAFRILAKAQNYELKGYDAEMDTLSFTFHPNDPPSTTPQAPGTILFVSDGVKLRLNKGELQAVDPSIQYFRNSEEVYKKDSAMITLLQKILEKGDLDPSQTEMEYKATPKKVNLAGETISPEVSEVLLGLSDTLEEPFTITRTTKIENIEGSTINGVKNPNEVYVNDVFTIEALNGAKIVLVKEVTKQASRNMADEEKFYYETYNGENERDETLISLDILPDLYEFFQKMLNKK
jgi:hypothetical protein